MEAKRKPIVGVLPLVDVERESYWMLPAYLEALEDAGALPLILPLTEDPDDLARLAGLCSGLLFTGGQDVSPAVYHAEDETGKSVCCPERDRMEGTLLKLALERDLPAFGICRGLQFFNAALGGSLWQDLPSQRPGPVSHRMEKPYDAVAHQVRLTEGGFLRTLLGRETLGVNSHHHQAIRDLAPCLRAAAVSEDGLVEAVELPGKRFVRAVQWHPEFCWKTDETARQILREFVEACGGDPMPAKEAPETD